VVPQQMVELVERPAPERRFPSTHTTRRALDIGVEISLEMGSETSAYQRQKKLSGTNWSTLV
jgi:hypothetical protein